ncbi:unnamed protein product [Aspergillus oryzae]|uniref:Unnamed protein product n=2 Tax=Aspergillus oryzae TaxID=5062 RepID=A0AAN4YQE5_ASPOZ|nr:unnamed protein product [Aspergillus oryzae]GMF85068.1 unnamed protein product [Aspergillus oryzae]GMG32516.1 unnamed protein product [Aspergillus oryzae]GMG45734.1 unnamed protein product [Aspergillus oryzae var. brunneus]
MKSWIQGTILGDTIRLLLGSRWLSYPEDDPTFDIRQLKCASCLDGHSHRDLESGQETFRYAEKLSAATKTDKSLIIDWYTPDDPENPLNWSLGRKAWVIILISLASGGASIQDLFSLIDAPYGFISWVTGFYCGPALGPLLAAYAVTSDWRWPLWEIVLMGAPLLLVIVCLLPETSHETILHRRAQRLRRFHPAVLAPAETKRLDFKVILIDALIKPIEIAVKDPAIAYMCVYSALVYAIYYSFFEAFPITYGGIYQMPQTMLSLIYLSLIVGCALAAVLYAAYLKYIFIPRCHNGNPSQEDRLIPALAAVWLLTAGLFMFAWAARRSVHWIVPTIGIAIYSGSSFVVFQAIIVYVPLSYPRYVASLYAANDFIRSIIAAGFVMFARYMYLDLGIGKGVTVLAGLSVGGIFGMIFIYLYGARLRARSKFAVGD